MQAVINLRERDMHIVGVHRQIRRQRGGRRVLHKLGVVRTADADSREAVFVNQLGQRQRIIGQPVRTQSGNDVNHVRFARLQPKREF